MNRPVTSIHLFYRGDQDTLLIDHIIPLLLAYRQERAISQFSFLRYWNGGDHLRLRLFDCVDETAAVDQITAVFRQHLQGFPPIPQSIDAYTSYADSMRLLYEKLGANAVEVIEPLHPLPCVEVRPYGFEEHRYGGGAARLLSEDHFAKSSLFAYRLLKLTRANMPARITLLLHLSMMLVAVIGDDPVVVAGLFEQASQTGAVLETPNEQQANPFSSRGFPDFDEQRPALEQVLSQLQDWFDRPQPGGLMRVPGQSSELEALLQQWQTELQQRWVALQTLDQQRVLPNRPAAILMTYLHLLFNRMDIAFSLECYTYYLIGSAINHLTKTDHVIR